MKEPTPSMKLKAARTFQSIDEFKSLQELPGSRPLAVVDNTGTISYLTNSFSDRFGLSEGKMISELYSEPQLSSFVSGLLKSKYRAIQIDIMAGSDIQSDLGSYLVDLERIFIGENEVLLLLFTSSDERKIFENRINTLHNALDSGNIPVIITDKKGFITYSTRSFEQIVGRDLDELYHTFLPQVLEELVPEEDFYLLSEALDKRLPWKSTISGTDANDNLWYQELQLTPVMQEMKELNHFIITAHDITQHIHKNSLVRQSEERQRSIINNISDMLLIIKSWGKELLIDNANDNFLEFIGITKQAVIGAQVESILQPDLYQLVMEAMPQLEQPGVNQLKLPYRDTIREKQFIVKFTYTDDIPEGIRYYIVGLADVTEQTEYQERLKRAYEKETQLNKLKSAFLANMSHEIRTPSMAIIGYANLLCDDITSGCYDSVTEMTTYMKDGIKRLLKLIDNIVEVSMIESEDYNFQFGMYDFNFLVENSFQELLTLAMDKSISIKVDFDDEMGEIETDETKVKKIIEAVVDNAIKYNVQNGKVIIKTLRSAETVTVYVSDTGRGIDEKKIDRILEPFVQETDEGHKRRYEGAGLGLTIAYRLTKALKGELKVKSKPGEGVTVIIKFPVRQVV